MNKESTPFVPRPFVLPRLSITSSGPVLPPFEVRPQGAMQTMTVPVQLPRSMSPSVLEARLATAMPYASPAFPEAPSPDLVHTAPTPALSPEPVTSPFAQTPAQQTQGLNVLAAGLLLAGAAALLVGGHMSGSTALLACAALFAADLARGVNVRTTASGSRSQLSFAAAIAAAVLVAWSTWGMLHQFSGTTFVLGLLVVLAILPVLLVNFVAGRILRRSSASAADQAVRSGGRFRAFALVITMAAGVQTFRSFSALPDALVTVPIVALAAANVIAAIRQRAHAD